jgi:hypothetical protein
MQTAQDSILERIKVSRGTSEPVTAAPTEATEVVNVSEDAPIESEAEPELQATEEAETEIEESEGTEDAQVSNDDDDEDLYVDYKGREINLRDVEEWEQGHLRQADYTRKTQELADSRKEFESSKTEFTGKESEFNDKLLTLEAMLNEGTKTAEEIAEMREYDPEAYITYTERQVKLKQFVDSSKTAKKPSVDMAKVNSELFAAHPEWVSDGKKSKKFDEDTKLMDSYAKTRGLSHAEITNFSTHNYEILLDAARYSQRQIKNAATEKAVRKAPVTTKPRGSSKANATDYDKAYKAYKADPSVKNAVALRKTPKPK